MSSYMHPAGGGVRLIKDVRDGRGVKGKADILREVAWIYSYGSS